MDCNEFRAVPQYAHLAVNANGNVTYLEANVILRQYILGGYWFVEDPKTKQRLRVHRLVALAWVKNPDPEKYTIVNHIDGIRLNNWYENLEWTNHSGNNYHAVNTGLRVDPIGCQVRDYFTKEVKDFPSVTQATVYMGLGTNSIPFLKTRKIGKLLKGRYEFRLKTDTEPWFYESRKRIAPSRYQIHVMHEDGTVTEHYTYTELLKAYQLYKSPWGKSVPALVKYGNEIYPGKQFSFRDGFREYRQRVHKKTNKIVRTPVIATKNGVVLEFRSLTTCAKYFSCDRSKVQHRLDNDRDMEGWKLVTKDCPSRLKSLDVSPLIAGTY